MAAKKRPNPKTAMTVYRTFRLDEQTREVMKSSRKAKGLTVASFLETAITKQLPEIVEELIQVGVPPSLEDAARPARLPMTDKLLMILKQGSEETGVPTTRLLLACIHRAANGDE